MMLFQTIKSITIAELKGKLKSSIQLIDVRTPNEYRGGHIRQAKNIPLQRINSFKGDQTKPVYVICQSGMRSKQATKELNKMGYQAINVRGGMNQWLDKTIGGK
ncbi:rhodanese-like domain-containing protein [Enterococcus durans]|uniref:Rhodanese-like domain-containing protein n=1 Tax=Enterococcus durans TaxID=53345 RepID=A0A5N0YXQ1_9ENTE|nr:MULTISPECIES: rhodanese-like domain-containing protein [Enterococcus]KAA9179612.1 rhodanese-like domain-containing protein [Enterococcus durans]KAA9184929.1 rhodanese-like domain-containing protein [Enterococcus durans]KAA9185998.1 rhodanese-like domain-containing protein [Enterococcus durans]KAA9190418.1 rhodanese-like domain-containing protein [Enterococcus durans]KAA9194559.1 rhodanese-like domain-containing protein [Enterococcus durans]